MNIARLRDFTSARVALGRTGVSLPTHALLEFQLAHARARDAVHARLDTRLLGLDLKLNCLVVRSAARDRATYLRRPDLGRRLSDEFRPLLASHKGEFDVVFVLVDGLSACAVQSHAPGMMDAALALLDPAQWAMAPVVIVEQGRVAIGDDVAECLGAALSVVLIGERPGLSSPNSLGIYLTWNPHPGITDAGRNCISNIHAEGLSYGAAAHALAFLMTESRRRRLSGVHLKSSVALLL